MPAPVTTRDPDSYNCEPARKSLGFWFCDLIAEIDRRPSPREKICPKCGATFSCGAEVVGERCWCNAVPPMPPPIEKDCFCPQCLKDEVAKRTAAP